jgi:homoserine O-acetyltransferase
VLRPEVPTVLCVHALTGDARVGGEGGWWEPLVGPGKPLDPRFVRVLCFNNLGSCYGTSGPADEGFPRLADVPGRGVVPDKGDFALPEAELPAPITTWDQARAILLALDALGVPRVDLACGGSVGGMIVLALAALAPERFPALVPIATLDRATPWIIGWNHIGRQMIAESLRHGVDPTRTLALARQIAHMTYRAGPGLMERHGRRTIGEQWTGRSPYAVQTYLENQGTKLVARFDPRAYVSQLDAMDHHDLARRPPDPDPHESWRPVDPWPGLARLRSRLDCVAIDSDELFFARDIHDMVVRYRLHGRDASWRLVQSPHGHDAFLMTWEPLRALLDGCIARVVG